MSKAAVLLWIALGVPALFGAQSIYDPQLNTWTISNGWVYTVLELTPDAHFVVREIVDFYSGDRWTAPPSQPSSPIRLQAGREQSMRGGVTYPLVFIV